MTYAVTVSTPFGTVNVCIAPVYSNERWQFGAVKVKPLGQGLASAAGAVNGTRAEVTEIAAATTNTLNFLPINIKFAPITF
jgi:hypothetical protein